MSRSPFTLSFVIVALFGLWLCTPLDAAAPTPIRRPVKKAENGPLVPNMEVRFTDGSVLKLKVLDERLTLKTPYGKLTIPLDKINEISCATRVPEAISKRVAAAIAKLGNDEAKVRQEAMNELAKLHLKAYPALVKIENSDDAEIRRRARELLEKIRKAVSEEDLEIRLNDLVQTTDSKITGEIEETSFRVETSQFGEVKMKLSDVRMIRALSFQSEKAVVDALADPGYLSNYAQHAGKELAFKVTGAVNGSVWGTDTYTLDSHLATAAVHAGILKIGQTGIVKVKILARVQGFQSTLRNGVQSGFYGQYPGFEIVKK